MHHFQTHLFFFILYHETRMCERPNNRVIGEVINATRFQITQISFKYFFEQRVLVITCTNQIIFIFAGFII